MAHLQVQTFEHKHLTLQIMSPPLRCSETYWIMQKGIPRQKFTRLGCGLHGRECSRHETTRGQKSTQGDPRRQSTRTTAQHRVRTAHQSLWTAVWKNRERRLMYKSLLSFNLIEERNGKLLPNRAHHIDEVQPSRVGHDLWRGGYG